MCRIGLPKNGLAWERKNFAYLTGYPPVEVPQDVLALRAASHSVDCGWDPFAEAPLGWLIGISVGRPSPVERK